MGLGLTGQIGLQITAIECYIEHFGFSRGIPPLQKEKLLAAALILCS